ncbi:hypothetical protein KI387_020380, partial [Taxus chinensis]
MLLKDTSTSTSNNQSNDKPTLPLEPETKETILQPKEAEIVRCLSWNLDQLPHAGSMKAMPAANETHIPRFWSRAEDNIKVDGSCAEATPALSCHAIHLGSMLSMTSKAMKSICIGCGKDSMK